MLPGIPPADKVIGFDDPPEDPTVQDNDDDDWEAFDDVYNITPLRLISVAGVLHPSDESRAYVFCGNRYVTIEVSPGTGDTTAWGSKPFADDWPTLWSTFGGSIDAVLPTPSKSKHMYFFSFENYALIDADPGT